MSTIFVRAKVTTVLTINIWVDGSEPIENVISAIDSKHLKELGGKRIYDSDDGIAIDIEKIVKMPPDFVRGVE